MSKGKEAGGRPRTVHAATNEEEVEKFVLKLDGQPVTHPSRQKIFRISQKPDIPHLQPSVPNETQEVLNNSI